MKVETGFAGEHIYLYQEAVFGQTEQGVARSASCNVCKGGLGSNEILMIVRSLRLGLTRI